ncbi:MAG: lipopolysaccharide biosynthesis protein [Sulfurimonas sp.]|uniref:lipopolysaccharide biosynthesis protein n=1 Tax=Sulfurimonas sp. TaxID=2022749 RepID=UPI003D09A91F
MGLFKPKGEFSRNVLTLMTGTAIAQAIPIAISPILTRIYTPEDFGVFALFVAIVGFVAVIASGRYEQVTMLLKYDKDAINIFALSLVLIFFTSIVSFFVIFVFKEEILQLLNNDLLENWLYFVPITVFFVALFNLLSNCNNRTKHYKDIAKATIIKSLVLAITQILIGFLKNGFAGLIIGQILAQIFANIKLAKNIIKNKTLLTSISFENMLVLAKKYINFPKYNMLHALLVNISSNLPIYLFTPFFGSAIVGKYSLAMMIVLAPMSIIATSTAKVYNQRLVELYNKKENTYIFSLNIIKALLKKILVPFIIFIVFAPQIFEIVFGEEWMDSGKYIQILSIYLILNVIVSIIAYIPSLLNLQSKAFKIAIIHFILLSIVLYFVSKNYDIYISLFVMCAINSLVLAYNFIWMTNALKVEN